MYLNRAIANETAARAGRAGWHIQETNAICGDIVSVERVQGLIYLMQEQPLAVRRPMPDCDIAAKLIRLNVVTLTCAGIPDEGTVVTAGIG